MGLLDVSGIKDMLESKFGKRLEEATTEIQQLHKQLQTLNDNIQTLTNIIKEKL